MTLRSSDLQSDSDLDSIRKSCDVFWGHPVVEMRKDKIISIVIIKQGADDKGEDK